MNMMIMKYKEKEKRFIINFDNISYIKNLPYYKSKFSINDILLNKKIKLKLKIILNFKNIINF